MLSQVGGIKVSVGGGLDIFVMGGHSFMNFIVKNPGHIGGLF